MVFFKRGSSGYAMYCEPPSTTWRQSAKIQNEALMTDDFMHVHIEDGEKVYLTAFDASNRTKAEPVKERNTKYDREIVGLCGTKVMVDVYRVLDAYPTQSPQLQHITKKSLATGLRGHKSTLEDLIDIRDSINSAIALHKQKA